MAKQPQTPPWKRQGEKRRAVDWDIRWQQLTVYCLSERNSDLLVTTNLLKTGCYVGFFGFVFLLKIRIFFFLSNCDDPWLRDYIPIFPFPSLVSMFAS